MCDSVSWISFTFINFEDKFKFVFRRLLADLIMRRVTNCGKESSVVGTSWVVGKFKRDTKLSYIEIVTLYEIPD